MLRNYIRVTLRNVSNYKIYSFINIMGLAIGIASCLLIFIYINDELSYDTFHEKSERIYRLNEFILTEGSGERSSSMPFPVGPTLLEEYPSMVKEQVRLFNFQAPTLALAYEKRDIEFNESRLFFVDSTFFDVFDFELISGNEETALDNSGSILLTGSMAEKYFGEEDPMGKLLRFQGVQDLMVTGVLKEAPLNGHFQFDFLVSMSSLLSHFNGHLPETWYWNPCWTYIVLNKERNPEELEAQFPDFIQKYFPDIIKNDSKMRLQPLTDIHLTSDLEFEIQANSSKDNVYVFSVIAVFILVIACINFMNLSTARSIKRAKEVGMRKALGGQRYQLFGQFLIESTLLTLIGVVIAIVLVYMSLPWFNNLAEKSVTMAALLDPVIISALVIIILVVGVGSGFYPALVLSSFKPVKVLKSDKIKSEGLTFRQVLVVVQFAISMILIIGTFVAIEQLNYLQNKDVGFKSEGIIFVPVGRSSMDRNYKVFKDQVLQHKGVHSVTALEEILGAKHQGANYRFEGMDESKLFSRLNIRHDFFKTFDMGIVAGRSYSEDIETDDSLALVVNEAMARQMGWENEESVGKSFEFGDYQGEIVGVVKDFNFTSKHREIGPLVLPLNTAPWAFNLFIKYAAIRIDLNDLPATLTFLEDHWKSLVPERPFEYFFLDNELAKLYKSEERLSKVAGIFSVLGIVVACLGLFGLASFTAEQRSKEIGIRKVMGSSVAQILLLFSRDFTKLIIIAFVIAVPVAYFTLNKWLENFAYQIEIGWVTFLLAGVIIFTVALTTIVYQSFRAASTNPVNVLRYE